MNDTSKTPVALEDLHNWQLYRDADDILWLGLDCAGESTNTLSSLVLQELQVAIDAVVAERPRGLIVYSAKESGFAAGADVREFDQMLDIDDTAKRIDEVHSLFARIENLSFPSVARAHGFCLGGGLELALACKHIVADDGRTTRLGFPEVLLGIHPGFGGTVRSVRYCGAPAALDLMLTGRLVDARRAEQCGLIDRAVPTRHLDAAALSFVHKRQPQRTPGVTKRLASHALARPIVARITHSEVAKKVLPQHYPAPYSLLDLWQRFAGNPARMYPEEARSVARLLVSPASRNLVRLYKLQEGLKRAVESSAKQPTHVHVVGAGTMGGDIAAWCALRGMHVSLQDRAPQYIAPAMQRAAGLFDRRIKRRHERLMLGDRLVADFDGDGIERADVIIEAIIEDVEAKRELFSALEARARPDAILATNTSSIPLTDIASSLNDPTRLVGIHFFNPVQQMQLVEIISSEQTDEAVVTRAAAFTTAIDRLPLRACSAPGFLINRVLSPYLQEAMLMLEQGLQATEIDAVAKSFGMPMGPLELADTVGLDICLRVGEILGAAFGGEVPQSLRGHVSAGRLGRKSNTGYHAYVNGKIARQRLPRSRSQSGAATADIRDRLLLPLLNEAVACLREGIVDNADLIDVALVFGAGFAPFRGGPIQYARDRGIGEILFRLQRFEDQFGSRFAADPGWHAL